MQKPLEHSSIMLGRRKWCVPEEGVHAAQDSICHCRLHCRFARSFCLCVLIVNICLDPAFLHLPVAAVSRTTAVHHNTFQQLLELFTAAKKFCCVDWTVYSLARCCYAQHRLCKRVHWGRALQGSQRALDNLKDVRIAMHTQCYNNTRSTHRANILQQYMYACMHSSRCTAE